MPRKLGQHFLASASILNRIAAAVCPSPEPLVIEIGPGKGALTEKLLERAGHVLAIEVDSDLVEHLRARFPTPNLQVIQADVLTVDLAQWPGIPIVGNLPYYITSPILEKTARANPPRAVFLIQKEVAQRLTAKPGTRDYGYLTVQTAMFAAARVLFEVSRGSFRPPPRVDSAVVLLEPRPSAIEDQAPFLEFIGRSFRQKRKTLRNNLVAHYPRIEGLPDAAMRAEQLSLDQFIGLWKRLKFPDAPPNTAPEPCE